MSSDPVGGAGVGNPVHSKPGLLHKAKKAAKTFGRVVEVAAVNTIKYLSSTPMQRASRNFKYESFKKPIKERSTEPVQIPPQLNRHARTSRTLPPPSSTVEHRQHITHQQPAGQHYQQAAARLPVSKARVTQRFHAPDVARSALQQHSRDWGAYASKVRGIKAQAGQLKAQHYAKLAGVINYHQTSLPRPVPGTPEGIQESGRKRVRNLEDGINTINLMLDQGKSHFNRSEKAMLAEIRAGLDRERSLILQVVADPGTHTLQGKMNWQTATEFKRTGYDLNATLAREMSTLDDSQILQNSEEHYGAGHFHSVTRQVYLPPDGEPVERIFKAEDTADESGLQHVIGSRKYLDTSRPRYAARNLAAQNLQKVLKLDLLPKMELATHNGRVGLLMEVARGKQPFNPKTGVSLDIPFDSPGKPRVAAQIQKNLVDAEWLDCLCGQQDRHPGNYFIDPDTGKVTLIDNDLAFLPGHKDIRDRDVERSIHNWVPRWPGYPALIDRNMFDNLMAMEETDVRKQLSGLLTSREVEATVSRLGQLKQHALKLQQQGKVVENWQTWRSENEPPVEKLADFLRHRASPQSYFNKAVTMRNRAMSAPPLVPGRG